MPISSEGKVLYHAAAVIACNYLTALLDASVTLCGKAGIDPQTALAAMSPLAAATLENVAELGTAQALTGPIARGDAQTIARHIDSLSECDDDLLALYKTTGKWALRLAKTRADRDQASDAAIAKLLDAPRSQE